MEVVIGTARRDIKSGLSNDGESNGKRIFCGINDFIFIFSFILKIFSYRPPFLPYFSHRKEKCSEI
jgi:hypothetical protein